MNRSGRIVCLGIAVLAAGLYLVTTEGVRANAADKKDLTVTGCLQKGVMKPMSFPLREKTARTMT